jgi:hypothetical protein
MVPLPATAVSVLPLATSTPEMIGLVLFGSPVLASRPVPARPPGPTRPPTASAPASPRPPPPVPAGPELQSILVSREPGGRRIAVISGEMVRQGSRFHGAVVEQVTDDRVVLRRGKARETLRLFSKPPEGAATPAARHE